VKLCGRPDLTPVDAEQSSKKMPQSPEPIRQANVKSAGFTDRVSKAEQIRRGIRLWLESQGAIRN
jgi:hypothetical protein